MKALKYSIYAIGILFILAIISPVRAVHIVNAISSYSFVVVSFLGNGLIDLALSLRDVAFDMFDLGLFILFALVMIHLILGE